MTKPTAKEIAARFGCTAAQVQAQFVKNAAAAEKLAEKCKKTGRKINGYTAQEHRAMADQLRKQAAE